MRCHTDIHSEVLERPASMPSPALMPTRGVNHFISSAPAGQNVSQLFLFAGEQVSDLVVAGQIIRPVTRQPALALRLADRCEVDDHGLTILYAIGNQA